MLDEPNNFNDDMESEANNDLAEGEAPPEESSNRTFLIVGGILGGLILLTLVCVAVYIFYLGPRLSSSKNSAQATIQANNAIVVQQMTSTAEAALWTPTPEPSATPTNTSIPTLAAAATSTPVVAVNTAVPTNTVAVAESATLSFLQTQLAVQLTTTAAFKGTTTKALAATGFFDEVGLPGLVILTVALVGVIFLARRLRGATAR
jgi:hypothetical protein